MGRRHKAGDATSARHDCSRASGPCHPCPRPGRGCGGDGACLVGGGCARLGNGPRRGAPLGTDGRGPGGLAGDARGSRADRRLHRFRPRLWRMARAGAAAGTGGRQAAPRPGTAGHPRLVREPPSGHAGGGERLSRHAGPTGSRGRTRPLLDHRAPDRARGGRLPGRARGRTGAPDDRACRRDAGPAGMGAGRTPAAAPAGTGPSPSGRADCVAGGPRGRGRPDPGPARARPGRSRPDNGPLSVAGPRQAARWRAGADAGGIHQCRGFARSCRLGADAGRLRPPCNAQR